MNYLKHVHVPHSCGRVHAPSVDAIKDVHWFDWSKYEKFYFKFKFGLFFNLSLKRHTSSGYWSTKSSANTRNLAQNITQRLAV